MRRYWTTGPFADWLRGTPSLKSGTGSEWDTWTDRAKFAHPVRYWLADEGLRYLQDFLMWPVNRLYDVKYYVNNRWVTRTHQLTAHPRNIKPGAWQDVGNRFLPCMFNELVDFVEIESAMHSIAWADDEVKSKYRAPFWASGWFRWRTWRCPQAGVDHLKWAADLRMDDDWVAKDDPKYGHHTYQAIRAQEILDLYTWWTQVYANRPDPYEASGWSAYCAASSAASGGVFRMGDDKTPALKRMSSRAHKLLQKIEAQYEREDEEMMIRLIKIRNSLWT